MIVITVFILVTGAILIYVSNPNYFDNINPFMKGNMIECVLDWGRRTQFPDSKTNFIIKTQRNMVTRVFRSCFYLPKEDLEKRITTFPGLRDAEIASMKDEKKHDQIKLGGNAFFAEVTIDFSENYVEIYMCSS